MYFGNNSEVFRNYSEYSGFFRNVDLKIDLSLYKFIMIKCKYCGKELATQSNLNIHQKKTLYCIKIQKEQFNKEVNIKVFKCDGCGKEMMRKYDYNIHIQKCKKNIEIQHKNIVDIERKNAILETENNMLKQIYEKSSNCVEKIAKQPKNVNNTSNTTNQMIVATSLCLEKNYIKDKIDTDFTYQHFNRGQQGLATFANDHILLDNNNNLKYVCLDPSRHIFTYMKENGNMVKDYKCNDLTEALSDPIIQKSKEIMLSKTQNMIDKPEITEPIMKNYNDICKIKTNNSDFKNSICAYTIKKPKVIVENIEEYKLLVLTDDYFKEQCKKLTLEYIKKGIDGYVDFALKYPFKDRLSCQKIYHDKDVIIKIKYKTENGDIEIDDNMYELTFRFFKEIQSLNRFLIMKYRRLLSTKINDINNDLSDGEFGLELEEDQVEDLRDIDDEINELLNEMNKVESYKKNIYNIISNGKNNKFRKEFVTTLCNKLLK